MRRSTNAVVYVLDDDESVCRSMGRLLRSAGVEAVTFASGQEFLDAGFRDEGACVVADVMMPDVGGLELGERLVRAGRTIPIILVTAFDTPDARQRAKKIGVAGYFRKPVDDQALLDAIEWALEKEAV